MKLYYIFSGLQKSSTQKESESIKQPQKDEIYHGSNYIKFDSLGHKFESIIKIWSFCNMYNKAIMLPDIQKPNV